MSTSEFRIIIFGLIILFLSPILWVAFGRDPKVTTVVEVTPPDNYSPLGIAYIVNEFIQKEDFIAMFYYFASKNYLKIKELKKDSFEITKLVDNIHDKEREYIANIFDGIFEKDDILYTDNLKVDLEKVYTKSEEEIKKDFESRFGEIFTTSSALSTMLIMTLTIIYILNVTIFSGGSSIITGIISCFIYMIIVLLLVMMLSNRETLAKGPGYIITAVILFIINICITSCLLLLQSYDLAAVTNLAMFTISIFFLAIMPAITKEGAKLLGRVKGFKNYLIKVEMDQLNQLINEDAEYFYNILPYAQTFALTNNWCTALADKQLPKASWFEKSDVRPFNMSSILSFNSIIENSLSIWNDIEASEDSTSEDNNAKISEDSTNDDNNANC